MLKIQNKAENLLFTNRTLPLLFRHFGGYQI